MSERHERPGTRFREIFQAAADEGLSSIGKNFKEIVRFHVNQRSSLTLSDLPDRPREYMAAVGSILGEGSMRILERVIAKRLYEKLGLTFVEKPGYGLAEYAEEAKAQFEEHGS